MLLARGNYPIVDSFQKIPGKFVGLSVPRCVRRFKARRHFRSLNHRLPNGGYDAVNSTDQKTFLGGDSGARREFVVQQKGPERKPKRKNKGPRKPTTTGYINLRLHSLKTSLFPWP